MNTRPRRIAPVEVAAAPYTWAVTSMLTSDAARHAAVWAASGAMALTGSRTGPPLLSPGRPATVVLDALGSLARTTHERTGELPDLPGTELLAERAACAGLSRNGPRSCGDAFRPIRTADGWWGLSLARQEDRHLIPALVEDDAAAEDPWHAVIAWASRRTTAEVAQRGRLLDLPAAAIDPAEATPPRPPVLVRRRAIASERGGRPIRVLDLSSLWAGPLCAHLLQLSGAEVTKVESWQRPDGARRGSAAFFDLLHAGQRMVALDFGDSGDRARLARLALSSDVVIEASRPRALARLGLSAEETVDGGTTWLSITARGREDTAVGFGDDIASGAGLFVPDADGPMPVGDAIADPLTGAAAAAAVSAALADGEARLLDVSMHHVAQHAAQGASPPHRVEPDGAEWRLAIDGTTVPVAAPVARRPTATAAPLGADNHRVLS